MREVGEAWKEGEARETNGGEGSSLYHHVYKWEGADPVHMELWPYHHGDIWFLTASLPPCAHLTMWLRNQPPLKGQGEEEVCVCEANLTCDDGAYLFSNKLRYQGVLFPNEQVD